MRLYFTRLQKILLVIILILLAITATLDTAIYRAFLINPGSVHTTYKTIKDARIPDSLSQVSAVYITDLEYGPLSDPQAMQRVFDQINSLNPDLFFFGGDLFSEDAQPSETEKALVQQWLSQIRAPLGKFAVYGEQDLISEERKSMVEEIYFASQVEVLDNRSLPIGNQSSASIRLAGLSPDPASSALEGCDSNSFTLVLSHYPDNLESDMVQAIRPGYALAGNAHGTQITWPIYGGYRKWVGSTRLNRASSARLGFAYYLSSGLGCIEVKARLNAPVEIVYLLFA